MVSGLDMKGVVRGAVKAPLFTLLVLIGLPSIAEEQEEGEGSPESAKPVAAESVRAAPGEVDRPETGAQLSLKWFAEEAPADEVRWLNGSAFSPGAFLTLYIPEILGKGQGGAVIIPDQGQHPDWPGPVKALRQGLAEKGWHTLSLSTVAINSDTPVAERMLTPRGDPEFPYPGAPERMRRSASGAAVASEGGEGGADAADSPAEELGGETPPTPREETNAATEELEQAAATPDGEPEADVSLSEPPQPSPDVPGDALRLELGLQYLNKVGLLNQALIGVGEGARVTLEYINGLPAIPEKGLVLVWINAPIDEADLRAAQDRQPDLVKLKILDIYDARTERIQADADARRRFARRAKMAGLEQVRIPWLGRAVEGYNAMLIERVSGWLRRAAPGRDQVSRPLKP